MATERPVLASARRFTAWYMVAAIVFILLGLFAIIEPATAAMGIVMLIGWLLILGGVAHLIATFRGGGATRVLFQILSAVVFAAAGIYVLTHPQLAAGTLTALLAVAIIAVGVFDIITYFRVQREHPSGWMLLSGIVALVLGGMIWAQWPSNSAWVIGTLVGVDLLVTGVSRLMFGLTGRRMLKHATA
jgi:uncharacterized membrane protein HdeD (DUF308 family)